MKFAVESFATRSYRCKRKTKRGILLGSMMPRKLVIANVEHMMSSISDILLLFNRLLVRGMRSHIMSSISRIHIIREHGVTKFPMLQLSRRLLGYIIHTTCMSRNGAKTSFIDYTKHYIRQDVTIWPNGGCRKAGGAHWMHWAWKRATRSSSANDG